MGNGETEISIKDISQLDFVMGLIQEGCEKQLEE